MSSRIIIPFLCVGAVMFACGPRTNNEAATLRRDSAGAATTRLASITQQGQPATSRRNEVAADLYVRTNGPAVSFALHVVNNTKKGVELTFPTGQTHDFVVLDSTGREMWRWAQGRMFTQTLRNKLLGRGESFEIEAAMRGKPLAPGRYIARAVLTSQNFPLVRQAEFSIDRTVVAAR